MSISSARRWFLGVAAMVAGVAALAAAPGTLHAQSAESGRVRVIHASPDTPAVDIFVDGQKAVTALSFPNNTGYVALPAGPHNVKVFVSPSNGSGAPALEANLSVAAGKDYTVLAVGESGKATLALLPLEDNNATPAAGKAHVRLIHASPDAPAVDVVVSGTSTKVFSNVAFKGVGAYTPVNAGTYNLDVVVAGTSNVAKSIPGLQLKDQVVYTVVAVGLAGSNTLQVLPLADAVPAPKSPAAGSGLATSGAGMPLLLILGVAAVALAAGTLAMPAIIRTRRS